MKVKCNCCGHIYDINATPVKDEKLLSFNPSKQEEKSKQKNSYYKRKKNAAYQREYYRKKKLEKEQAALNFLSSNNVNVKPIEKNPNEQ